MMRIFLFSFFMMTGVCKVIGQTPVESFLEDNPAIDFQRIDAPSDEYGEAYLLMVSQLVDHQNPAKGYFKQRVWLTFRSQDDPMVMVTEGYQAQRNYLSEPALLLKANQLIVEHRYFDRSCPDSLEWEYLNLRQATADLHAIRSLFHPLFSGKWIATGISKGGQTAIAYRAFYPDDVDLSIPYVAPVNYAREDERLFAFFHKVGTPGDRKRIADFQQEVLRRKLALMPMFIEFAAEKGMTFRMGHDRAFELAVLEYPFSFWQWGGDTASIPSSEATDEQLFQHLRQGSDFGYFSDQEWNAIKPFFFQAYQEMGYYAYVPGSLKPFLSAFDSDTISSSMFAPGGDTLSFRVETMDFIRQSLQKHNPEIIAIVGENDPWGATAIDHGQLSNTLKVVQKGGNHRARIHTMDSLQQLQIFHYMEQCLGCQLYPQAIKPKN